MSRRKKKADDKRIRCAIYTRKSHEEGLDQEYNSLDSQRDAGEAFVASQYGEGWTVVATRYDDAGFSGGNLERPAMQRLMADIEAGEIDCVVVYKVDRLSRSLLDFARIMGTFDEHGVSFVSVTQHFNTTHSMGRLTLNILLSFAQFEREIIGERIRDKIAGQRRRGQWAGGHPVLGYDVDRSGSTPKLVINGDEAAKVRRIFAMYLEHEALLPVVQELERLGWTNKRWRTKSGKERGGRAFDKSSLHSLLTNNLYVGRIRHKEKSFDGVHTSIVEDRVFAQVQTLLRNNSHGRGKHVANKYDALLRGLLVCPLCGKAMVHNVARRKSRVYRYYTCLTVIKSGRGKCEAPTLPAAEIEAAVVDHVREIASDADVRSDVLAQSHNAVQREMDDLKLRQSHLQAQLVRLQTEITETAKVEASAAVKASRLGRLHVQIAEAERSLAETHDEMDCVHDRQMTEMDVNAAFADFDNVWDALTTLEKSNVLKLMIHQVSYDASRSSLSIKMHPTAIKSIAST